jgi:23S rRNA (adenine1618-N6)-methyltransferase
MSTKRPHPSEKSRLHPRNQHRERYDFKQLIASMPELAQYVKPNIHGDESIDFFNPEAVKTLNKALLKHHYGIDHWEIPPDYLCPPIPGRADYIHHMADLLALSNGGKIPRGEKINCLDIGVGANCVYPIVGRHEYGWSFVGTDIDTIALDAAKKIILSNKTLEGKVELRHQEDKEDILNGVIAEDDRFDLVICNPPFHASLEEAKEGSLRKLNNLSGGKFKSPVLNFGGQYNELWFKGGEARFIRLMIIQSKYFSDSCFWFSTIVSKKNHLRDIYEELEHQEATDVQMIPMGQGNKTSRVVAWTFLTPEQRVQWARERWNE